MKIATLILGFATALSIAAPVPSQDDSHSLDARAFNPNLFRRPETGLLSQKHMNMEEQLVAAKNQRNIASNHLDAALKTNDPAAIKAANQLHSAASANRHKSQKALDASWKAHAQTKSANDAQTNAAFARANAAAAFKRPTGIVDMAKKSGAVITTGSKSLVSNFKAHVANARANSAMRKAASSQQKFEATQLATQSAIKPPAPQLKSQPGLAFQTTQNGAAAAV